MRLPVPPATLSDWAEFVDPALTAAARLLPGSPTQLIGVIETSMAERRALVMRYGAQPRGRLVDPNGVLRVPYDDPDDQPLFFIDIDSYWTAPNDDLPPFDPAAVLLICDDLHAPTRDLFETSITKKLREEVLRVARSPN